ncbi:Flavin carrier protein 2 [Venturia nashicola]|uniref:Flavin carrier protein 2 n=1 Tax=Venturia nashicola TaxID=86259 RepID=A0A4Z1PDK1_9PEZI|nr:Flavin carrier protein 2 [Venturia nashicola]
MASNIMAEPLNNRAAPLERVAENMEKPALDNRSYRVVKLANELEALLIHDPETDKASGALDVNVGSFSDKDDMPGLAHAVEHMLFMGTEKYPKENAYNQYLSSNSGSSNAYTASTSTNYYFEVAASSTTSKSSSTISTTEDPTSKSTSPLYGALDRFAQFFVAPLFLEDTLDRELKAVDSENKKNLQSDTWRLHQLSKSLANPEHPYCHFSTGSYKTLKEDPEARGVRIRDEFIGFYQNHYSANRMKLVVLGRESLDELEGWVEELFSPVVNKNLARKRWDHVSPLTENELMTQIFAKPVVDTRSIDFNFRYPDEEALFEAQPNRYLSHLIGHEGPGSILAYLKNKGWASSLGAGGSPLCPGSSFFNISVRPTEEGLKHYQEIVEVVFQYIAMLKETLPQQWIFEELKRMSEVDFRFKQKSDASKTTSALSSVMQKPYPRDCLLSGPGLLRTFAPEAIKNGLAALDSENFRLTVVSQNFPGDWDKTEKWYGTQYKYERIPQDFMQRIRSASKARADKRPSELHLPHKNEFLPARLDVERKEVSEPLKFPKLVRNDDHVRTWYKKDDRFWVPKANLHITLRSPLAGMTPHTGAMSQIYTALVQDALNEYAYDAEISGLDYSVGTHSVGLDLSLSGYNDKMAVLLEKVLKGMRDLEIKPDRFAIIKERLMRTYKNWHFQQPYQQVGTFTRWLASDKGWSYEQYEAELPHITEQDVRIFFPQLLHQLHIEVLAHGNLYREDALRFTDLIDSTLRPRKLPQSQWPIRRSLLFPPGSNHLYERKLKDPANINHCIEYLLHVGNNQDRVIRATNMLFASIADEPCFDQLRTKEQLGYVVFSGASVHNTTIGYRILIQSEKTPKYLESRIDAFLESFGKQLNEMSEEQFSKYKTSLINKRSERLKNLTSESSRFWNHILAESYDFEQVQHDVHHIERLNKEDLIKFFDHYISPASESRAKLAIHLVAQGAPSTVIESAPADAKNELMLEALAKLFKAHSIDTDMKKLGAQLEQLTISADNPAPLADAVLSYLIKDAKIPEATAMTVVQGLTDADNAGGAEVKAADHTNAPTIIEDVHAFKASLDVSRGPQPVKDLSEFEDLEAKL